MEKLCITNEILGALALDGVSDASKQEFINAPKDFILAKSNHDLGNDVTVSTEINKPDEVHLVLPYYTVIEQAQSQAMSDSSMDDVAGGEVIFVVLGLSIGVTATAAAAATVATGVLAGSEADRLEYIKRTGNQVDLPEYLKITNKQARQGK